MAGGVKGAKPEAEKTYEHQEYPKVLYAKSDKEGEPPIQKVLNSVEEEEKFLAKTKREWTDSPADHLDKDDPNHPDNQDAPEVAEGEEVAKPKKKAAAAK